MPHALGRQLHGLSLYTLRTHGGLRTRWGRGDATPSQVRSTVREKGPILLSMIGRLYHEQHGVDFKEVCQASTFPACGDCEAL